MRRSSQILGTVVGLAFTVASSASGAITYVSQSRSVNTFSAFAAGVSSVPETTQSAPDFAPFSGSVTYRSFQTDAMASATQESALTALGIQAQGTAYGEAGRQTTLGIGQSVLDVVLSVSEVTFFTLSGNISVGRDTGSAGSQDASSALVRLTRLSDSAVLFSRAGVPNGFIGQATYSATFNQGGVLLPGVNYRFEIDLRAGRSNQLHTGSYAIALAIPAPGAFSLLALAGVTLSRRARRQP